MNDATFSTSTKPASISELITRVQALHGLSDEELGAQLGYPSGSVIAMLKRGAMGLPLSKVTELAEITELDLEVVLELALQDRDPVLLELFKTVKSRCTVSPGEQRLLDHCRKLANGRKFAPVVFDGKDIIALLVAPT